MPNLPYELLDHIVDHLEYDHDALGACCLVSKSWIPRTREHLFAWIDFQTRRSPRLQQWKKAFPDSSTSPAHYAKYLAIGCPQLVTEAGGEAGNWIASFSSVEELKLGGWGSGSGPGWEAAFILLHAFSPVLKVLRVDIPSLPFPHIFDLVLSFPLLEDLDLLERPDDSTQTDNGSDSDESPTVVQDAQPSNLPVFTGSLNLFLSEGVKPIVYWLLSSQSGIHFQKLTLGWVCEEDIPLTTELVERCSGTLEYLYISFDLDVEPMSAPLDLSKATKLEDVKFVLRTLSVKWITLALQSVGREHKDLRRIAVYVPRQLTIFPAPVDVREAIGEELLEEFLELDRFLVNLWKSLSIRPSIIRPNYRTIETSDMVDCVKSLVPEMAGRGMIGLFVP